jgi:hypothetical protein
MAEDDRSRLCFYLTTILIILLLGRTKRVCAGIQARMPVFLPEEHHDRLSGEAGKEVVVPWPTGRGSCKDTMESAEERNELVHADLFRVKSFPERPFKNISICKKYCKIEKMQ